MSRRPHILLLGMQFPPARGSGVYRIRSWANHFVRRGCDVTVLAADRNYWIERTGVIDPELEKTIDPRVKIVHVDVPREHLIHDVRKMSWSHANFPRVWTKTHQLARERIFPEVYASLLPLFVAKARRCTPGTGWTSCSPPVTPTPSTARPTGWASCCAAPTSWTTTTRGR